MKRLFLFLAIPLFIYACKDQDKGSTQNASGCDTLTSADLKKLHTIDDTLVMKMASYYRSMPHDTTNIIQSISMNALVLRKLLYNQKSVRWITAAYVMDGNNCRKGDVTVILQLWDKNGKKVYYDTRKMDKTFIVEQVICPPPINCDINSNPATD